MHVLFSDESRFSLSSDCRRQLIWRESGTAYRPENVQEKDRYPTSSIMVWAGIMINGRTRLHVVANGTMTGQRYIDEVLLPHVRLFRGAVGDKFVFMDDNATCHRTLTVQDCLDSEGIRRHVWPARSPDLNPIENVWDALGRQVAGRNYPLTNKNTLIRALTEEWDKLPQQLLDNVVQSMNYPTHLEEEYEITGNHQMARIVRHNDEIVRDGYIRNGGKELEVSKKLGITQSVISRLWQRFQDDGNVSRCYSTGLPRVTTPNEDRHFAVTAKRNRRSTASDLSRQLSSATGTTISRQTMYRRLEHIGLYARRPIRCVPLTATHCRLRLTWSREHALWTTQQWSCMMFSDESRTDLHVQSVMMTGHIYPDVILEQPVRLFGGAMRAEFLFMDDNAHPHRTNIVDECLQSEDITRMD
ncbi:transposable element Tcb1 transposase [Trichonephila clavipes]|nr:transposable element Tcb1 transposase [Trichonephila clavipes]